MSRWRGGGSEEGLRALLRHISDTITVLDVAGNVQFLGGNPHGTLGYEDELASGANVFKFVHPEDLPGVLGTWEEILAHPGRETRAEYRARAANGTWEYFDTLAVNLVDHPLIEGIVVTSRNITERKCEELLLADRARILEIIAHGASLATALRAVARLLSEHASDLRCAIRLTDTEPDQPQGVRDRPANSPSTSLPIVAPETGAIIGELSAKCSAPRDLFPRERRVLEIAAALAAIAVERARAVDLARRALHDDLTGLPNRSLLLDRLDHALRRLRRHHGEAVLAVVFIDLDGFKSINDTFGHAVGDRLLAAVGDRLRHAVRPSDTVARLGGDEFVVVCEEVVDEGHARSLVTRLRQTLERPFELDGSELLLRASMGLALASSPQSAAALLEEADNAMYRAKREGGSRSEELGTPVAKPHDRLRRGELERDLQDALESDRLLVHYQPMIDLTDGAIVGVEALVRWHQAGGEVVPSSSFISLAEDRGLVLALDEWVLDRALAEVQGWLERLGSQRRLELAVNLSVRDLARTDLIRRLEGLLRRHEWVKGALWVELTERRLHQSTSGLVDTLEAVHALGVRVAVDDFGTGQLSLGELRRLPLDSVKLDGTRGSPRSPRARSQLGQRHAGGG